MERAFLTTNKNSKQTGRALPAPSCKTSLKTWVCASRVRKAPRRKRVESRRWWGIPLLSRLWWSTSLFSWETSPWARPALSLASCMTNLMKFTRYVCAFWFYKCLHSLYSATIMPLVSWDLDLWNSARNFVIWQKFLVVLHIHLNLFTYAEFNFCFSYLASWIKPCPLAKFWINQNLLL